MKWYYWALIWFGICLACDLLRRHLIVRHLKKLIAYRRDFLLSLPKYYFVESEEKDPKAWVRQRRSKLNKTFNVFRLEKTMPIGDAVSDLKVKKLYPDLNKIGPALDLIKSNENR